MIGRGEGWLTPEGENSIQGAQTCSQLRAARRHSMRKKNKGTGAVSYAHALKICQNLAEITAYEMLGDQILHPADERPSSPNESLVLMPGIRLTSDKMAEGIARLGTSALGVRAVQAPTGEYIADFTVLFATGGSAERYEDMRAWLHRDEGLYLIPDDTGSDRPAFQFVRGLRKVAKPWSDEADRLRGLGEAATLLLGEGADTRRS